MLDLSFDQQRIEAVATAIAYEQDGKQLRREMAANLRAAVAPALPEIRSRVLALGSPGGPAPALASTVASKLRVATRLTGDRVGVRVSIGKAGMPRGFRNAPKRLNRAGGWRHPLFGDRERWYAQTGAPGFFDDPLTARRDEMRAAVRAAVEDMSERIARRAGR